jgi:hypothetical protein
VLLDSKSSVAFTEMNAANAGAACDRIGINVNQQLSRTRETATSLLLASGSEWSRVELTAALLIARPRVSRSAGRPDGHDKFAPLQRCPRSFAAAVRIEENGGFEGVTDGLTRAASAGCTAQGSRIVLSGTVRALY